MEPLPFGFVEVYIMGCGTAGSPCRHPRWRPELWGIQVLVILDRLIVTHYQHERACLKLVNKKQKETYPLERFIWNLQINIRSKKPILLKLPQLLYVLTV